MLSKQTKSFFLVLLLAVGSLFAALIITRELAPVISQSSLGKSLALNNKTPQVKADAIVDTKDWIDYEDPNYSLSFKYPKDWMITTYTSNETSIGYIIILKSPNPQADHIRIYINKKGYVAIDGFDIEKTKINGINAITVSDMLVGIRQSSNYITFDLGTSPELLPYFKALLKTVEI